MFKEILMESFEDNLNKTICNMIKTDLKKSLSKFVDKRNYATYDEIIQDIVNANEPAEVTTAVEKFLKSIAQKIVKKYKSKIGMSYTPSELIAYQPNCKDQLINDLAEIVYQYMSEMI